MQKCYFDDIVHILIAVDFLVVLNNVLSQFEELFNSRDKAQDIAAVRWCNLVVDNPAYLNSHILNYSIGDYGAFTFQGVVYHRFKIFRVYCSNL